MIHSASFVNALIRYYTFSDTDLSTIRQQRVRANHLGFAVQLCYLRFPGIILVVDQSPFPPLLKLVADNSRRRSRAGAITARGNRRAANLVELQTVFGFQPFTMSHYRQVVQMLTDLALQIDEGIMLAEVLIEHLRGHSIILLAINAINAINAIVRICTEAITRANRCIYVALNDPLSNIHRHRLNDLLKRDNGKTTWLAWLRQSPAKPNS